MTISCKILHETKDSIKSKLFEVDIGSISVITPIRGVNILSFPHLSKEYPVLEKFYLFEKDIIDLESKEPDVLLYNVERGIKNTHDKIILLSFLLDSSKDDNKLDIMRVEAIKSVIFDKLSVIISKVAEDYPNNSFLVSIGFVPNNLSKNKQIILNLFSKWTKYIDKRDNIYPLLFIDIRYSIRLMREILKLVEHKPLEDNIKYYGYLISLHGRDPLSKQNLKYKEILKYFTRKKLYSKGYILYVINAKYKSLYKKVNGKKVAPATDLLLPHLDYMFIGANHIARKIDKDILEKIKNKLENKILNTKIYGYESKKEKSNIKYKEIRLYNEIKFYNEIENIKKIIEQEEKIEDYLKQKKAILDEISKINNIKNNLIGISTNSQY